MRSNLPSRRAAKRRPFPVGVLHHQCRDHRRSIRSRHAVGINDIMDGLNRNRVRARLHLVRHVSANKLPPRRLLPRRQLVRRHHLCAVNPGRHSILARRKQNCLAHGSCHLHRSAVGKVLLRALFCVYGLRIGTRNPCRRRTPHCCFLGRLVANPFPAPAVLCQQGRLPPRNVADSVGLLSVPHCHAPPVPRARLERRTLVRHVQAFISVHLAAVPHIRLAGTEQLGLRGNLHPVCRLPGSACWIG